MIKCCSRPAGEKETMPYFAAHFEKQLELYTKQVGLVHQDADMAGVKLNLAFKKKKKKKRLVWMGILLLYYPLRHFFLIIFIVRNMEMWQEEAYESTGARLRHLDSPFPYFRSSSTWWIRTGVRKSSATRIWSKSCCTTTQTSLTFPLTSTNTGERSAAAWMGFIFEQHAVFTSSLCFLLPVSQSWNEVRERTDTDRCHFWHHHWHEVGLVSLILIFGTLPYNKWRTIPDTALTGSREERNSWLSPIYNTATHWNINPS